MTWFPPCSSARWSRMGEALRALVVGALLVGGCTMGVGYSNGYDGDYPPDAYVATTVPYYYNGYPTYYYPARPASRDELLAVDRVRPIFGLHWSHHEVVRLRRVP
jgi:hypothetical protein